MKDPDDRYLAWYALMMIASLLVGLLDKPGMSVTICTAILVSALIRIEERL